MDLKVSSGIKKRPYFITIYGPDGVGKTSFAADAPSCLFVGPENGSSHLNVSRADDIKSWNDVVGAVKFLNEKPHSFKTVALDSLDWIEQLLIKHICDEDKVDTIGDAKGGYGKGYEYAVSKWMELIRSLELLRDKGINVIAIAHAQVKTFNDPNQSLPYDRYMLKLNDKAAAKWREAVDVVGFANFEDTIFKLNKSDKKAKASGGEVRKLYTERRAAFDAKNRLGLPSELALSWAEFERLANLGAPDSLENVQKQIAEISVKLKGELKTRMDAAIEKAKDDVVQLSKILNHAQTLVEA